jgi:hypothetical protein
MITIGHWCWSTNLDILYLTGIDPLSFLKHVPGYEVSGNYGIAMIMSFICCFATWFVGVTDNKFAPYFFIILSLFWINPLQIYKEERMSILQAFYRSIFLENVDLSEVILCDILTSYARIISQTLLESYWMIFPMRKIVYQANRGTLASIMDIVVPLLVS